MKGGLESESWDGLCLAVSPDRALIGPEAARLLLGLLAGAARTARRDGIRLSPALLRLRDVLAVVSSAGQGDVPSSLVVPVSEELDEIGTEEAAAMVGVTPRHARRLARAGTLGPVRQVGGRLMVSRAEVAAYTIERKVSCA